MLSVAIAEDHPIFQEALKQLLENSRHRVNITKVSSFDELVAHLDAHPQTHALLLDLEIPGAQGFSALIHVHYHFPDVRVAIVSGHDEPSIIRRGIQLGAESFVPKSMPLETIILALDSFLDGDSWLPPELGDDAANKTASHPDPMAERVSKLTPQQRRIALGVARGQLNKQIAYELGVTEGTVKNHVTTILRHLQCRRRTEIVAVINNLMHLQGSASSTELLEQSQDTAGF